MRCWSGTLQHTALQTHSGHLPQHHAACNHDAAQTAQRREAERGRGRPCQRQHSGAHRADRHIKADAARRCLARQPCRVLDTGRGRASEWRRRRSASRQWRVATSRWRFHAPSRHGRRAIVAVALAMARRGERECKGRRAPGWCAFVPLVRVLRWATICCTELVSGCW